VQLHTRNRVLPLGSHALIMGILNVTPDSFSDGSSFLHPEEIAAQVGEMLAAGVDIIDVGGESTRPFAEPVSLAEELSRVLPAIECIRGISPEMPISIDTSKARVAEAALSAGADIINDVSALRFDPEMVQVTLAAKAPVIIMHMLKTPRDMQIEPSYSDVVAEIKAFLSERISWAEKQGLSCERIIVDPGIGFGKTMEHNLTILKHLAEFRDLGCPLLVGHSRKAFIGRVLDLAVQERDVATAALSAFCANQGADIIRVHDVKKTVQAVRMIEAVRQAL